MALDTPARIAIVGAGPTGLEAALYARFLGYDVEIYEQADVAAAVRVVAHQLMPTSWNQWTSPLGLAALQAQGNGVELPAPEDIVHFERWLESYLVPLSQSDLLQGRIHTGVRVEGVRGATIAEWEAVQASAENNSEQAPPDTAQDDESQSEIEEDADPDDFEEIIPLVLEIAGANERQLGWTDLIISATGDPNVPSFPAPPLPHMHRLTVCESASAREAITSIEPTLKQIRDLFAVIAGRKSLDLYRSMAASASGAAS